jgi:hypothetical protein
MQTSIKKAGIFFSLLLILSSYAFADSNDGGGGSNVSKLVGGYSFDQWRDNSVPTSLFYQSADSVYNVLVGNAVKVILAPNNNFSGTIDVNPNYKPNTNSAPTLTAQAVANILTAIQPNNTIATMAAMPAPGPSTTPGVSPFATGGSQPPPTQNVDPTSLLGPLQYDANSNNNTQQSNALSFITFVTNLSKPMLVLDTSKATPSTLQNSGDVQNYLVTLRTYATQQALAISNFYQMYANRIAVDISGKIPGVPGGAPIYPKTSPLMLDQYMATRRFNDSNWAQAIQNTATPSELMRQQIYFLAEIRYELYQNRLMNERILATLSLMTLQGTSAQAVQLQQLYTKAQTAIAATK